MKKRLMDILIAILLLSGCSQTIYDRTTLTVDPNGVTTLETVHVGSTSLATAKTIDDLLIRTDRGVMALNGASAVNDSLKIKYNPYTGVALETSK